MIRFSKRFFRSDSRCSNGKILLEGAFLFCCFALHAGASQAMQLLSPEITPHFSKPGFQTDISVPDIVILEPEDPSTKISKPECRLRALIRSRIPLTNVTVMLNGKVIQQISENALGTDRNRYLLDIPVPLSEGRNVLSVTGTTNQKTSSKPEVREIFYEESASSKPNLIVLAVGISSYAGDSSGSSSAGKDAEAFSELMKDQAGGSGLYQEVKVKVLTNEEATRLAIFRGLEWANQHSRDTDVRVVFLSGRFDTEHSEGQYFLSSEQQPHGDPAVGGVSYVSLLNSLSSLPARTVIFIDGKVVDKNGYGLTLSKETYSATTAAYVMTSAPFETDVESRSLFIRALVEGLKGPADLPKNGVKDGLIDTGELHSWLESRVKDLSQGKNHIAFYGSSRAITFFKVLNP